MALPVAVTANCWAYCLPINFFPCIPGTILWEAPHLSYRFACHRHGKTLGLLSAFQCLSLHYRHDTMGATVSEPWLCLSSSQQNAGPIVCLSISSFAFQRTILRESPYLSYLFACQMWAKCCAHCLSPTVFLCITGTILWEPLYLSHGFACHHHNKMLGLLSAFQFLALHFRHDTMGVTVPEPWLCLTPSQRNSGPTVCVSLSLFAFQAQYYERHRT